MKTRCYNANATDWPNYGGRGIRVCDQWRKSYEAFRDWSISHGYADALTIDRINVDGNYNPSNCRWITMAEQMANQQRGRLPDGRHKKEIADAHGVKPSTYQNRIARGWDVMAALTTPPLPKESFLRGYKGLDPR